MNVLFWSFAIFGAISSFIGDTFYAEMLLTLALVVCVVEGGIDYYFKKKEESES